MTEGHGTGHRYTRRGVLGASAALGMAAAGAPAALAATTERPGDRPADIKKPRAGEPDTGTGGHDAGEVWGVSASGQGIGVRGSGRLGVLGEGTHTGVAG